MIDFKTLAENILSDLMGSASISDILLKTKIFASKKGDNELLKWVEHELNGYENEPPKYRIIPAGVKVLVFQPFKGTARVNFPSEIIMNEKISERLSKLAFHQSVYELEEMSDAQSGEDIVCMRVPVAIFPYMREFINGDIQDSYQYAPKAAIKQIVVTVKSLLIDFLLKISNDEDLDFNTFIKQKPIMITNNTYNAAIINTGSGDVNAQGSTNVVGNNNTVNTAGVKEELFSIIEGIDKLAKDNGVKGEYDELSKEIKDELAKPEPSKSLIKRCFQLVPSFFMGVNTGIVANGLTPLVQKAIELISSF